VFSKSATELRPKLPALLEDAAMLYLRIGTCRLNNMAPEKWLRYVIEHIQDWPANWIRDLLPWKVDLSAQ
ncbi:TPA: transposase domain-containing protein, partial [Escherichia coli]|nr:transposase domain-containing protein [Escherichia coli]HCL9920979.1 transposase domain-containing protein [Escherichia coli]